jgi:hypothetical protein
MSRGPAVWTGGLLACSFAAALAEPALADEIGAGRPKASLSAKQLREGLLQRHQSVRSVYAYYRADDTYKGDRRFPPGSYLVNIVAAKAPYQFFHVFAHGHDTLDWRDDRRQQTTYVTADKTATQKSVDRTYTTRPIKPTDPLPGTMPWEFYFAATGLWPTDGRPTAKLNGRPYMLLDIATNEDFREVRAEQDLCDGRWCHVLECPGYMRLWIDAGRGFVLMARETINTTNGALIERIESLDHREFRPGVWLPTRFHNLQYDHKAKDPAARGRKTLDSYLHVRQTRVNDVEDELFEYKPPPGAIRLGAEAMPPQTATGGLDLVDDLARWIEVYQLTEAGKNPAARAGGAFRVNGLWVAATVVVVLVSLCEAALLLRGFVLRSTDRRHHDEPPNAPVPV